MVSSPPNSPAGAAPVTGRHPAAGQSPLRSSPGLLAVVTAGAVALGAVAVGTALAGCGGGDASGPTTTQGKGAPISATIGLGATAAAWDAHHSPTPGGAAGSDYGPQVATPAGERPRFGNVTRSDGHVAGWTMTFRTGTSLEVGVMSVRAQLPGDAEQTAAWSVPGKGGHPSSCEVFEYQSATIRRVLPSRFAEGSFGVVFTGIDRARKPHTGLTTSQAKVGVPPSTHTDTCPG